MAARDEAGAALLRRAVQGTGWALQTAPPGLVEGSQAWYGAATRPVAQPGAVGWTEPAKEPAGRAGSRGACSHARRGTGGLCQSGSPIRPALRMTTTGPGSSAGNTGAAGRRNHDDR